MCKTMKLTAEYLIEELNIINPDEEIRILDSYVATAREFLIEILAASDIIHSYKEQSISTLLSTIKLDNSFHDRLSNARDCFLSVPIWYAPKELEALIDILVYELMGEDTNFFRAQHQTENKIVVLVS